MTRAINSIYRISSTEGRALRGLLRVGASTLAVTILLASNVAQAQDQQSAKKTEQNQSTKSSNSDRSPRTPGNNVIVVTGIRASIESARNSKRNSDQIKDVIDAEDIGKLPDTNAAEALQRVTGVQITRTLGEGSGITVRGFSENRVEVDGQTEVGASADGSVSYDAITSEAFKSIEVVKTQSASDVEGALGAIVRFNTRKPLDSRRNILALSADAQYAQRADKWTKNINALTSLQTKTSGGMRLGLLFNFTYKGRKLRQDFFDIVGWTPVDGFGRDLNGNGIAGELIQRDANGIITNLGDGAYVPLQTRLQVHQQDRDLYSGTVSLQAKTDNLELYLDTIYTENKAADTRFMYIASMNTALQGPVGSQSIRPVYQQPQNALISPDQTVLSAILGQINPNTGAPQRGIFNNFASNSVPFTERTWTISSGINWDVSSKLKMRFNFAHGEGWQKTDQFYSSSGLAYNEWPFFFFDFSQGTDIPTLVPLLRQDTSGQGVTQVTDATRLNLLDLSTYYLNSFQSYLQTERNQQNAWRLDFDWDVNLGPINSIQYGGRLSREDGERSRLAATDYTGNSADGTLAGTSFTDLNTLLPGLIVQMPYGNLLNGATGDFPHTWLSLDPNYIQANVSKILQAAGVTRTPDLGWGYNVNRETQAAYLRANFNFMVGGVSAYGNFGVRYVHTSRSATGSTTSDATNYAVTTVDLSYDNWLPSFNLVANLGSGYFVRFGAAKAMARPNLNDIAPLVVLQQNTGLGRGGNAYLRPEKVFQLDLSFEKYYGRSNLLSLALFYKDFSERIEDGVSFGCFPVVATFYQSGDGCPDGQNLFSLNTKVNAGAAKVKGFEAAWQQTLNFLPSPLDGFGFIVNYTYVDAGGASLSPSGLYLPVQNLSKNSYNLIGYYEKYGFSARLAYNWRSNFYDSKTASNFGGFTASYGQLDGSISYDITKKLSIQAQAINFLNAPEIRYQEILERPLSYRVNDRRFLFGFRWKN